nr:hypothetical protein [Streptomyces chartreusis]
MPARTTPQPSRGPVPDVFLSLLAGHWVRALPSDLRRSRFLLWLYGLHAHADPHGWLNARQGSSGVPDSLARTSCTSLRDGGRFLAAALAAGVVTERQPGRYALATTAAPDWEAASAVLSSTDPGSAAA